MGDAKLLNQNKGLKFQLENGILTLINKFVIMPQIETPNKPESLQQQLEDLHSRGIILSNKAEKQLKEKKHNSADLSDLKWMARNIEYMEEIRLDKEEKIKLTDADIDLIEGNLRRINDVSEIKAKNNKLQLVFSKYQHISHSLIYDELRFRGRKVPANKKIYRDSDLKKVHSIPLEKISSWLDTHYDRVILLDKLVEASAVPSRDYKKYRDMEPKEALKQLEKIKKGREKKEHASADATLNKELSKMA